MIRPIGGVILVGALVIAVASMILPNDSAIAQEAKPAPNRAAVATKAHARVESLNGCVQCHAAGPVDGAAGAKLKSYELVTLKESNRWAEKDLHSIAWRVLVSPLGKRMSQLLNYEVSTASACLTCHGVDSTPAKSLADKRVEDFVPSVPEDVAAADRSKFVLDSLNSGVSCEGCHGNARDWNGVDAHQNPKWREKDPSTYKQAEMGLIDLRNPEQRATKCASCHIGNAAEGKIVTHEMYAAGHPPLPAFELATFSRDEPAHYMPPSRNLHFANILRGDLAGQDDREKKAWKLFHYDPHEIHSARLAAVGSVINLREYLRTLSLESAAAIEAGSALDWTHFNCSACHHDLRYPSQRQSTGYLGKPGRLFPRMWSVIATRAVLEHAKSLKENEIGTTNVPALAELAGKYEGLVENLLKAFDKQQYGSPKDVRAAADELEGWCSRFVALLDHPGVYNPESAKTLANMLQTFTAPEKQKIRSRVPFNDYDTAQHLFWAWSTVSGELSVPEAERKDLKRMTNSEGEANIARMSPLEWKELPAEVSAFAPMLDIRARWQTLSSFLKMPSVNLANTDETLEKPAPKSIQELSIERSRRRAAFDSAKFTREFGGLSLK